MYTSVQGSPMLQAVEDHSRCRVWRLGRSSKPDDTEEPVAARREERRGVERRGGKIQIFRFNNDRRLPQDRRGRVGRCFERAPLFLQGELRHQGVRYRIATAELSARGASLLDAPALPIGATVRLTLQPSDELSEYPLVLWAQVGSFCSERAMLGVRFVSPRACDSRRLERLVEGARTSGKDSSFAPYRF